MARSLALRGVRMSFSDHEVIGGLDLAVEPGEFLVLLGPSGCGKSTLLHGIAGLLETAGGTIEIGGRDVTRAEPSERDIAMVFQTYALYPSMTAKQNMSFGLRMKRTPKQEIERRVDRAAEMLHLQELLDRKPSQLSGGQRQRVAIGRAVVREAAVFLFDEPLSNLDAKLRNELRRELKLLHKQLGSTMIYVTHDQAEAMTLGTRIVVMRGGQIMQSGAPAQVYERPANVFVAGFLGSPAINLLHGVALLDAGGAPRFTAPGADVALGEYAFDSRPDDGRAVVLGIRPENVRIGADGPLHGTVSFTELFGNHQVVWIDSPAGTISAIADGSTAFSPDEPVRFAFDASRVSLFDEASGQRL